MFNYSFLRLSDGETIPLCGDCDAIAVALLGQRDAKRLSMAANGRPEYLFAKSSSETFWCRPNIPVYAA